MFWNLIIKLDQDQKKVKMKKDILMKVNMLFMRVEKKLSILSKVESFDQNQHKVKD